MKKFLRIIGYTFAVIALIAGGFALFIQLRGIPSYEAHDPGIKITPNEEMVKEGGRLAMLICKDCHYNPATNAFTGSYRADVSDFGKIYSANITQDKQYGIGNYTDGQILYILRTGIKPDGTFLPAYMPKFVHMSDNDIQSIVAWLKSSDPLVKPAAVPDTVSEPNFLLKFLCLVAFKPLPYPEKPIVAPDTLDKVAYGHYVVTGKVQCFACHSKSFETVNEMFPEKTEGFLAGGNPIPDLLGQRIVSANLTPDKTTGIGDWSEEQFIKTVRFGNRPDGTSNRYPMPPFTAMTEMEAKAVYAYLKTLAPVAHEIKRELYE